MFLLFLFFLNILVQTILNCAVTSLWSEFVIVPAYERAFLLHVFQFVCDKIKSIWLLYEFLLVGFVRFDVNVVTCASLWLKKVLHA